MTFIKLILLIILTWNYSISFSQELVFVNGNCDFKEGTEIFVTLQPDKKDAIEFNTKNRKINLHSFSFDSIVTLKASGFLINEYVNQYSPEQFKELDTISLHQFDKFYEPTPRMFLKKEYNLDSAIRDEAQILKGFLFDSSLDSVFFIEIYHSQSLSKKDKKQIKEVKKAFCKEVGVDEKKILVRDKNIPYLTSRFDFFNPGTLITERFIENQNTPWMKAKAEEYSLVLVVEIVWSKMKE